MVRMRQKKSPRAPRVKSCIRVLWLAASIIAVTPRVSGEIILVSRLSDARAFAVINAGSDSPPPQIQTDFLPATLSNSATVSAESGAASANCTSNSSIVADNQMGTLQITGNGEADAYAILMGSYGSASAKLIVTSFTLADRSYSYSLTGQLLAEQFKGFAESTGTAKLTTGGVTIFEVVAALPPAVILSQTGVLEPGDYIFSVEINAAGHGDFGPHAGLSRGSANFNFALGGPAPTPTPTPTPTATPASRAINLSTRMRVQTGDNVGIAGFIISGSAPKPVLLRALGPSLAQSDVPNVLADPVLRLVLCSAEICIPELTSIVNDNWRDTQEQAILATGIAPSNDLESAILTTLLPGTYTATVSGRGNTSGTGLIEVYDLEPSSAAKLANLSTRAFVETGNEVVITGFVIGEGSGNDQVAIRGLGPSLAASGLSAVLTDPTLELRDSNGVVVLSNNDWQDIPIGITPPIFFLGLAPTNPLESAIVATLPPGAYTALLSGVNNGTGVGLVEVYDRVSP